MEHDSLTDADNSTDSASREQESDVACTVATSLWGRPAGIAEVLRVAMPLMISTGCLTLTLFADRTLLLWFGSEEMAASMASGNLFWSLVCFPVGLASMTSAMVAQCVGSGQSERIGRVVWQGIWLGLAVSPLYWLLIPFAEMLFSGAGQAEELIGLETTYMRLLLVGASGVILEPALSGFFSGIERTRTVMWVNIAATVLNLVLDVVLIFGCCGFPAMGIAGAGIATCISFWAKAMIYFWLILRPEYAVYGFAKSRGFDAQLARKLLFFGVPAGLQFLAESSGFALIVLQIGQVGTDSLAATAMAINFNMAAFVPLIGVSIAASILVGRHLLESGPELATRAAVSATIFGIVYAGIWALAYLLVPDTLFSLYELGSADAEIHSSIDIARILLRFVAAYCLLDAAQIVIGGALRGAGDTWYVLFASLAVIIVWVTIGLFGERYADDLLASQDADAKLYWWWWMLTGWIASMCLVMVGRFVSGGWQQKRMV